MERQFSERQLIRWAVPGWITLFILALLLFVHLALSESFRNGLLAQVPKDLLGIVAAFTAAAIAMGFALGFMLFQVYYPLYWRSPVLVGGELDDQAILSYVSTSASAIGLPFGQEFQTALANVKSQRGPGRHCRYDERKQAESLLQTVWWRAISRDKESGMVWEAKDVYLISVYHALGAVFVGLYVAAVAYGLVLAWTPVSKTWDVIWPAILNLGLLAVTGVLLWWGRTDIGRCYSSLTKYALHHFYAKEISETNKKPANERS